MKRRYRFSVGKGAPIWPILLTLPIVVAFSLVVGLFIPIPLLDVIAAGLSGLIAWLWPIALILAVLALALWRVNRSRFRLALATMSGLALLGWSVVAVQGFAVAARENVDIDVAELFLGFDQERRQPDLTLEYTRYNGQPVTLSIWRPAPGAEPSPILLMTHGGGFASGSVQEQLLPYARWFANQGYLVIGANYTLSSETVHAWDVTERQIACALAWAGQHAAEYGGDISRLGMYGESAGGNLVINTSYKLASGALDTPCGPTPQVHAVATLYPALGLIEAYENRHFLGATGRKFDEQYTGGSPQTVPERYASVQSVNAVTPAAPPTLLVFGASDHLVPPSGTRAFTAAAREAGIAVRPIEIPYGEHGFDLVPGGLGGQIWRQTALQWFEQHLPPSGGRRQRP